MTITNDLEFIDFLSDDGKKVIAVVEAYLDESGTHDGAPLLVVAGFAGDRKAWKTFTKEWTSILKRANVDVFHARNPRHDFLKEPLARCITKREFVGVAVAVKPEDFRQYAGDALKTAMGGAYSTCAIMCAEELRVAGTHFGWGPISLVYEAGQPQL